ncbi:helix-turn-helix domain-containing protein [Devosia neptuniae]|jgi:DNA-binding transcriptional MerR regulator|uniref:helix-turn-helix domain-containing protein n=1 Tax=Devosia TaxID=46913 RepID=UPI0022AE8F77|nr:helix-turn-helix domain-containing protein [Devosia neptuniae]MCZ4347289.1 helix-turn-helix domain-containing protein [Devosia neptuniae]|tara:strand:+ start:7958 stop:8398 length:441 start_codon:yes stop_codon:yes gene_type:complete
MKVLDIGEVSARSGIKPSALRYYEEVGLIEAVARHGLRRQFGPEVLLQLKLIAMGKSAGFSLGEIVSMFGQHGMPDLPRSMFQQKAEDIDRKIEELGAMRDTLRHIANCPAPSHLECPSFRQLLGAVSFGEKMKAEQRIARKSAEG